MKTVLQILALLIPILLLISSQSNAQQDRPEGLITQIGRGTISDIVYIADGEQLAVATSNGIWIYDTQTYKANILPTKHSDDVTDLDITSDGNTLVSLDADGEINTWDAKTLRNNRIVAQARGSHIVPLVIAIDQTGKTIIALDIRGGITTIRMKEQEVLTTVEMGPPDQRLYKTVDIHPTKPIYASSDILGNVVITEITTKATQHKFQVNRGEVNCVLFSPDGNTVASGSENGNIHIWDINNGNLSLVLKGEMRAVNKIAFSPDSSIIAGGCVDGTIHLWETETGRPMKTLIGHKHKITAVSFSPDFRTIASGSTDGSLRIWNIAAGRELHVEHSHVGELNGYDISGDGKTIAALTHDKVVGLWDTTTGINIKVFNTDTISDVKNIAIHPLGSMIATTRWDNIFTWDVETEEMISSFERTEALVEQITFSPDGNTIATASVDGKIRLWNAQNAALVQTFDTNDANITHLTYSPDGRTIAFSSKYRFVRILDLETSVFKHNLRDTWRVVSSINFSADSKTLIVTGRTQNIYLWDVETGTQLESRKGLGPVIVNATLAPDMKTLVAGDSTGTISFVDVKSGELLGAFQGTRNQTIGLTFISSDGEVLVIGGDDGTISLWDMSQLE